MCGWCSRGGDVDLAEEPLAAERGGDLGVEDLDRDAAVVLVVLGQVDRGHPAPAQQARHLVRAEACPRRQRLSLLTGDPRDQRRGVGRGGLGEELGGASRRIEQSLDLAAQTRHRRSTAARRPPDGREGRCRAPGPRPARSRPTAPACRHSSAAADRHCGLSRSVPGGASPAPWPNPAGPSGGSRPARRRSPPR